MSRGDRKLSLDRAEEIRKAFFDGESSKRVLAARFGVSRSTISRVLSGRIWRVERCESCGGLVRRLTVKDGNGNLLYGAQFYGCPACEWAEERPRTRRVPTAPLPVHDMLDSPSAVADGSPGIQER
jgi:hypothetical protein